MQQKYFVTPFGNGGDRTVVPDAVDPSGLVSYTQGWGIDYQRDPSSDPLAKEIDRATMNYLLFTITQALKQYQENGAPEFITAANNGGVAFAYNTGNVVRFQPTTADPFVPYISLVDNNTDAPNTVGTVKWQPLVFQIASQSEMQAMARNDRIVTPANIAFAIQAYIAANPVTAFQSGQLVPFCGAAPPVGTLAANGAAVSRTTYAKLFAAIGTTYGPGDGSTTFNLPNFAPGSVARAVGTGFTLGTSDNGQVISHTHAPTLTAAGLHTHPGSTTSAVADHQHTGTTGNVSNDHTHAFTTGTESTTHTHSGTTAGAGGHAHNQFAGTIYRNNSGEILAQGGSNITLGGNNVQQTAAVGDHAHNFGTGGQSALHTHSGNTGGISSNHTHNFTSNPAGGHSHTVNNASDGSHVHALTIASTGGTANTPAGTNVLYCVAY